MQTTSFGRSSNLGTLTEMGRSGRAPPQVDPRHSSRNPISWTGIEEPQRSTSNHAAPGGQPGAPSGQAARPLSDIQASLQWKEERLPPPLSMALKEEQMGQTWAELMRTGNVKGSAALTMMVCSPPLHLDGGIASPLQHACFPTDPHRNVTFDPFRPLRTCQTDIPRSRLLLLRCPHTACTRSGWHRSTQVVRSPGLPLSPDSSAMTLITELQHLLPRYFYATSDVHAFESMRVR